MITDVLVDDGEKHTGIRKPLTKNSWR